MQIFSQLEQQRGEELKAIELAIVLASHGRTSSPEEESVACPVRFCGAARKTE